MKRLIIVLSLISPAYGTTLTVCASCAYSTAQAGLNASHDGDTIILASGQNLGSLTIPGNRHDLTIKSSQIDSYPRGYRIARGDPTLARLTTISAGGTVGFVTPTLGSASLTSTLGSNPTPHGLVVGDKVVIGGTSYSAYACASVNQPPYTDGACDASRVGFMNIRTDTGLANGNVLYFRGRTLPPPLVQNTPYYIVNFVRGGSVANADKFQLSTTPGGSPILIPQFNPAGQDLVVEVRPLPQAINDLMYVVATPSPSTLQLSPTPGGAPTVWTQVGINYDGSGFSRGFSVTKIQPVYNLVFDGIEVFPTTDQGVYYPFYISNAATTADGENHDIHILRCWIHGADDQQDFPMATLNVSGRNLEVGWSIIENAYSVGNDTQGIEFLSTGNVAIHDNEVKGASEGIMSGGNLPWFAFTTNTTGISVYRNYLWKPLKAYVGIVASYVSPTQFQLLSRYGGADCSTVASNPNLGLRCFAYESEESDPVNAVVSRTEWIDTAANSIFSASGSAGQQGYIYLLGGVIHMDYNYSGTVSCPAKVTCAYVATPSFPVLSTRLGIAIIGSGGAFDGTFYQQNRNVVSKNLLESKYGDNWLIEGNVFHRQSNCDGGVTCQDPAIQLTVAGNGSGPAEPVNYTVSSSNSTIRNNIFRMLSTGIVGVGKTFPINIGATGLIWEWGGFGKGTANRVENNLFMDIGSTEYSPVYSGSVVRHQDTQSFTVQHNTAVDARLAFSADGDHAAIYRSNIVTPYRSVCPSGGCTTPAAASNIANLVDTPDMPVFTGTSVNNWQAAVQNGNVDAASSFDNNLIMNRSGFVYVSTRGVNYPMTTWMVQSNDPGRDPASIFTNWQERNNSVPPNGLNYRAGNYRLAPGIAAAYPSYDQRAIGADIDEIEALTGRAGVDVERGWPTFAQRTARQISARSSTPVLSYLTNGSPCTIQVWSNSSYSGTPVVNTTDAAASVLSGVTYVNLIGIKTGTAYFGKRRCGSEVDVFSFGGLVTQ